MPLRALTFLWMLACAMPALGSIAVSDVARDGDFALVADGRAAPLVVDIGDHRVVAIAASCLAEDIERVAGRKPALADASPQVLRFEQSTDERNRTWQQNVLRNTMTARTTMPLRPGKHVLRLWGIDASVAVQGVKIAPLPY